MMDNVGTLLRNRRINDIATIW